MYARNENSQENKSRSAANTVTQKKSHNGLGLVDNRSSAQHVSPVRESVNNVASTSNQPMQLKASNEVVQLLRTADAFDGEVETAGGVTSNMFFKAIGSGLREFQTAGQPKSVSGRLLHNLYEGMAGPSQATSTDKLKALDSIEHAAYAFLNTNVGGNTAVAGRLRVVIDNLLNDVQQEHRTVIETEMGKGRVPYFRGQEGMSKQQLTSAQGDWKSIVKSEGSLKVSGSVNGDPTEQPAGFSTDTFANIRRIMGSTGGRSLVHDINADGHDVNISPVHPDAPGAADYGAAVTETDAKATGLAGALVAGPQRSSRIQVEPNVADSKYKSQSVGGHQIFSPSFVMLAHEMVHTRHNQLGMNRKDISAGNYVGGQPLNHWGNMEEHYTIDTGHANGDVTENSIRAEHGLNRREGHD